LARRQAINTVIQGSAADVIKLAMLAVFHDRELARMQACLVLQVHDELLLEAPREHAEAVGERVAALMRSVQPGGVEFRVPLLVDWGYGAHWAEAH
jgi:DNA polymerase-1